VELDPQNAECHYSLGTFLAQKGNYGDAANHLAKALELQPSYPLAEEGLRKTREALAKQVSKPE